MLQMCLRIGSQPLGIYYKFTILLLLMPFRNGDIIDVFHNDIDVDTNDQTFSYQVTAVKTSDTSRCYR